MPEKLSNTTHHSSAVTIAIMEAVDRTIRATRPKNPKATAIAGLLGAVLAILARDRGSDAPRSLPRLARGVADQLVRASLVLARELSETPDRDVH